MCHTAQFKGSSFTLSVLQLYDNDLQSLCQSIEEKVNQAPAFFAHAPIVLDVSKMPSEQDLDFAKVKGLIESHGMIPVAVTGCPNQRWRQQAQDAGLAIVTAARQQKTQQVTHQAAKVIRHPVRSGQQVYANNCDLVVMNHVSAGAELIADGSIHVYGTLRGRAIAGASGNQDAQIYCDQMDAELVSIAGNYWLNDAISEHHHNQAVMVYFKDNQLHIEQLRNA